MKQIMGCSLRERGRVVRWQHALDKSVDHEPIAAPAQQGGKGGGAGPVQAHPRSREPSRGLRIVRCGTGDRATPLGLIGTSPGVDCLTSRNSPAGPAAPQKISFGRRAARRIALSWRSIPGSSGRGKCCSGDLPTRPREPCTRHPPPPPTDPGVERFTLALCPAG